MKTKTTGLHFRDAEQLAAWLEDTKLGQELLASLLRAEIDLAARKDRRHVLVVLYESLMEVYAGRGVTVLTRSLLEGCAEDRTAREEYLRQSLPLGFRKLYRLKNQITTECYRAVSPESELAALDRKAELALLKEAGLWPPKKGKPCPTKPPTKPQSTCQPKSK